MRWHGQQYENLVFPTKGRKIIKKAKDKVTALKAKIEKRERDITEMCKALKLESAMDVLLQMRELRETISNAAAPSGEKAKLERLVGILEKERAEVEELEMIIRNLPEEREFELSFSALEYFGF